MNKTILTIPVILMAGLMASAQQTPAQAATTAHPAPTHSSAKEQIVTRLVRGAWALGGKTPEGFFEIVKALTEISAQKRGLVLPENEGSGVKAGEWIKAQAKKDPDQLLYAIVDQAVQHTGKLTAQK